MQDMKQLFASDWAAVCLATRITDARYEAAIYVRKCIYLLDDTIVDVRYKLFTLDDSVICL